MAGILSTTWTWDSNITLIIAVSTALLIIMFIKIKTKSKKPLNLPPGSYGWPIFGETLEFLHSRRNGTPEVFFEERVEKYKSKVLKTSLMGHRVAMLYGPVGNKFLFSNENKLVTIWWPPSVRKILGECLSTTRGIEGMQMRNMMSYFMTPDAFTKLYIKTMDLVAQQHIETHWQGNKEEVKVAPTIKLYTFELACRLFMSIEDREQISKLASLFKLFLMGIMSIPINFPGTRFYQGHKAASVMKIQIREIVRQRKVSLEQKIALPSQDLLSHLLVTPDENGKYMSESVIVNNILLLLFAGHDTSSVSITALMKKLAEIPEIYEKVLREQNEIAKTKKEGDFLQWEDIQKMRYSWNVVCETARLSPPVLGAFREALVDIKYEGYDIPKGWKLYWSSFTTHMDPNFFPDSKNFNPSRFEGVGPIPYSYVPFGGGPRMCLGKEFARLEILIFLYNVIRRFKWELKIPDEKIIYDPMPTPMEGLPVRLQSHTT